MKHTATADPAHQSAASAMEDPVTNRRDVLIRTFAAMLPPASVPVDDARAAANGSPADTTPAPPPATDGPDDAAMRQATESSASPEWLPDAPRGYRRQVVRGVKDRTLVVALSTDASFNMYREGIHQSTIFLVDGYASYFTRYAGRLSAALTNFAVQRKYQRIVLVGSSKAGYGALLHASLIAQKTKRLRVAALAFSPQTRLHPFNDALYFPSYKRFIAKLRGDHDGTACLETYGDLAPRLTATPVLAKIIYGDMNEVDSAEALRLAGVHGVTLKGLPISIHGAVFPYTVLHASRTDFDVQIRRIHEKSLHDADLAHTLPPTIEELARQIRSVGDVPTLRDLIDQTAAELA